MSKPSTTSLDQSSDQLLTPSPNKGGPSRFYKLVDCETMDTSVNKNDIIREDAGEGVGYDRNISSSETYKNAGSYKVEEKQNINVISLLKKPQNFGKNAIEDAEAPQEKIVQLPIFEKLLVQNKNHPTRKKSPKSETPKKEKKAQRDKKVIPIAEPPMKILTRKKSDWETFEIETMRKKVKKEGVYQCSLADNFELSFEASDLYPGVIFCTLQKTINKTNFRPVNLFSYALFTLNRSDIDIRNGVKELYTEISNFREGDSHRRVNEFTRAVLPSLNIKVLETLVPAFPEAVYYCSTCDYHLNNVFHTKNHIEEKKHVDIKETIVEREKIYKETPKLFPNHSLAIENLLNNLLTSNEIEAKTEFTIAEEIQEKILNRLKSIPLFENKEITLKLFGSTLCGTNNADSDLNFYWNIENIDSDKLLDMKIAVEANFLDKENPFEDFSDIEFFSNARRVRLFLLYKKSKKVTLEWKVDNEVALFELFQLYTKHNPRVTKLMKAIRNWAKVCNLLPPNGLSKRGFDIMTIHYLQQTDKLLILPTETKGLPTEDAIEFNVAEEFVGFFGYYSQKLKTVVQIEQKEPIKRDENKWSNKMFQIKSPYSEENIAQFQRTYQPYFLNCFLITFIYFSVPRNINGPIYKISLHSPMIDKERQARRKEQEKTLEKEKQEKENIQQKVDGIEPESINAIEEIMESLVLTVIKNELVYDRETMLSIRCNVEKMSNDPNIQIIAECAQKVFKESGNKNEKLKELKKISQEKVEDCEEKEDELYEPLQAFSPKKPLRSFDDLRIKRKQASLEKLYEDSNVKNWSVDDFVYSIEDPNNFTLGLIGDIRCIHCDKNSHESANCPEMRIPVIIDIDYVKPKEEWDFLNFLIEALYKKYKLNEQNRKKAMEFVYTMQATLRREFPDARLQLFGSMKNGFGTANSDADICFRFQSDTPPEDRDTETVINAVATILRKNLDINTQVILGAKVPIVKFKVKNTNIDLEGDISYYNTLALSNTKLLKCYTAWDDRVAPLGIFIKKWANVLDIGDASRGSLSSYSYIIMLIHFLQRCDPPVLPYLQEQFRLEEPEELNCGYDVYFHKDGKIKGWCKNEKSVGELFVEFLDFYAKFDYKNMVIQIRREKPLAKLEKAWNRPISLEDPFDLKHNLGTVVNLRMFCYIHRAIIQSREIFMKRLRPLTSDRAKDYKHRAEALFKSCSPGFFPQTRACYYCFRHGHMRENCPRRLEQERLNSINLLAADQRREPDRRRSVGNRQSDNHNGNNNARNNYNRKEERRARKEELNKMMLQKKSNYNLIFERSIEDAETLALHKVSRDQKNT